MATTGSSSRSAGAPGAAAKGVARRRWACGQSGGAVVRARRSRLAGEAGAMFGESLSLSLRVLVHVTHVWWDGSPSRRQPPRDSRLRVG